MLMYDPYQPTVEWFTGPGKEEVMPLSAAPEPKRRWIPSKWEKTKGLLSQFPRPKRGAQPEA